MQTCAGVEFNVFSNCVINNGLREVSNRTAHDELVIFKITFGQALNQSINLILINVRLQCG